MRSSDVSPLPELKENCIKGIIGQGRAVPCQMLVNLQREMHHDTVIPFGYT